MASLQTAPNARTQQSVKNSNMKYANDNNRIAISADAEITVDLLECCLDRLAIAMHREPQGGEIYLPLFERLEREIEALKASQSTMARAKLRVRR